MSPPRSFPQSPLGPLARLLAATGALAILSVAAPAGAQTAAPLVLAQVETPLPRVNPERGEGAEATPAPAAPEIPPAPQVTLPAPSLFATTAYPPLATPDLR
ncbi:MAG: hypothetical protein ACWA6X_15125, partial [Bauldia sp.]